MSLKIKGRKKNLPTDYCFSVDVSGLMFAMQDLGDKARWPQKVEKSTTWKDKSKWCAYHDDFGHLTEDCIILTNEIVYLINKGYLQEILRIENRDPKKWIIMLIRS